MTTLTRIGLLGDIHAEDASLALALRVFGDAGVDGIVSVGDIVDGQGDIDRCCALLAEASALAVRGNHERWYLAGTMRDLPHAHTALGQDAHRFIASLPPTIRMAAGAAGDILVCHGLLDDDMASIDPDADTLALFRDPSMAALLEEDCPLLVLNGHTHHRALWTDGRLTVVNAGTLFRYHRPCFAIVDLVRGEVTYHDIHAGERVERTETRALPVRWRRG
ncbi:Serine/threonine protein phosphatase [Minicystis rosea]|nr:Serine/threonine protein phosphatase [Minicystis rosea]